MIFFLRIHRDFLPAKFLSVFGESEAIEEISTADEGMYQRLGMAFRIWFDRHLGREFFQHREGFSIVSLQMLRAYPTWETSPAD